MSSSNDSQSVSAPETMLPCAGWHEAIALPGLGISRIYAKLDTGSDHSVLHAAQVIELFGGREVEFSAPLLRHQADCLAFVGGGVRRVRLPVVDERIVRSSNGAEEHRYVVETEVQLANVSFQARFSLTNRDGLRFAVLLGRSALASRFFVDSSCAHRLAEPELGPCA